MAELQVPPLLAHTPEATPPWRRRLLLLPLILALVGILIATACAITGQDTQRDFYTTQMQRDYAKAEADLAQAELRHADPAVIRKLRHELDRQRARKLPTYAQYGRHFTQWDGYRYEEIITSGYLYHHPDDPDSLKNTPVIPDPSTGQPRLKNVAWYPLYPLLGFMVSALLHISANAALTVVSQVCILLAPIVLFFYARRHYYNRTPRLAVELAPAPGDLTPALDDFTPALSSESHPMRRWDLSPQDTAALWACVALLYSPCSIFLYANFTESLFTLLLVSFLYCVQGRWWWRAALIAAVASACRAQGVLLGPVLAAAFFLRSDLHNPFAKCGKAFLLLLLSAVGISAYMAFLGLRFGDPLAFTHIQSAWNVGIHRAQVYNALNPAHALTNFIKYAFYTQPVDWPRVWEAACVIWPPIMLLILGGRFLSFELELVGWLLWGLPYISNGLAGNPPASSPWMSMGRFIVVLIPAHIIFGAVFARFRWAGVPWLVLWASAFAVFAVKFGMGNWVG